ncbi:vacuolar ATPase assembly integral membrane protein vma21 [Biomphalaria glabrata]|uniref:Vacuolar ATPase assembly integral membrane protein VMA21 n=1 Tax=Biomphalaria pfeifferi TaxID=112525 RepID=A0AAD8B4H1_BIOPF|nr:vacuolar ATPase assembly integral membrane protein VMA21 [Biomphalaria glabrata]KAK0047836.1 vacuolar ATPase assembly integral membrane protein VMA21 [Biomphalaria pfeifferi]
MNTMLVFTIMMIVLPIFSYFFSKSFIFEGLFGMVHSSSYFYAAAVAIAIVHVILGMFIYVAWTEDSRPIPQFKAD